jgi:MFS transporter, DHA1 family, multidrug resistance protein
MPEQSPRTGVPRVRARMIAMMGAVATLGPMTIDMYLPALPKIANDL